MIRIVITAMLASLMTVAAGAAFAADAPKMKDVATCRDGKIYSNTTGEHRGACSGHGGVAAWSDGSPVKSHGKSSAYRDAKGTK